MGLENNIIKLLGKNHLQNGFLVFDNKVDLSIKILPNFTLRELLTKYSKDSTTILNVEILKELQHLRDLWGKPVRVNSGYRSLEYNKTIRGSSPTSQHVRGNALDIAPVNGNIREFQDLVKKNKKSGGIGIYNTFVHIDTGATRTWRG